MAKNYNKAFTIVELLVAIALLVILVALSSVVFTTTVKAHRKATASIEITRNLRVLTDQLNTDFQGFRKEAPVMMWFYPTLDLSAPMDIGPGCDMIHFFADGNFQTTKQYDDNAGGFKTVYGNIARIWYGHANTVDIYNDPALSLDFEDAQLLTRKSHVLTSDSDIIAVPEYDQIPLMTSLITGTFDYTMFANNFGQTTYTDAVTGVIYTKENALEFNTVTLTQWLNALNYLDGGNPDNADAFIEHCMDDDSRPYIDLADIETLHLLMAQGVSDFQVQWAYTVDDLTLDIVANTPVPSGFASFVGVRWWPSRNPNGDNDYSDSDFSQMNGFDPFGVYFTLPGGTTQADWFDVTSSNTGERCKTTVGASTTAYFRDTFYPKALKFTFTLHDSNGVFEDGKTFTHIVYLD